MREARMKWSKESILTSEFSKIAGICDTIEVLAHLDVKPEGVRQLVRASFSDEKSPTDLDELSFLGDKISVKT